MTVHPRAAVGFGRAADAYERARPDYPPAALSWLRDRLVLGPGRTVIDLAAGTGKLTRLLLPTGAHVIAVEPVAEMRAALARAVPAVETLDGTAEAMPLPDGAADAVTVAQAFHWFSTAQALAEIHRVLRPGGSLALVWNRRDLDDPLQHALDQMITRHRGDVPTHRSGQWKSAFDATELFGPFEEHLVPHHQELDRAGMVDRVMSTSVMAALPDAERRAAIADLEELAAGQTEPIQISYTTQIYLCVRR
ncbi:MAG TPA: methyltransferase domain-containing protein [Acidimicrobiales bacterium]